MVFTQRGFTLIEISIVLIIIGLLLGGVLKGQEMINDAKIRNIEQDMAGIAAAIHTYQDRYKALPGDDKRAAGRWAAASDGDGDGLLEGDFDSATETDESRIMWRHLRYAGLLQGDPAQSGQPRHAAGGLFGVQGKSGGLLLCARPLTKKFADIIDAHQDDGQPDKGVIRVFAATGAIDFSAPLTSYDSDESTAYSLCKIL